MSGKRIRAQVAAPRTGYTTLGWCNLPSGGSA